LIKCLIKTKQLKEEHSDITDQYNGYKKEHLRHGINWKPAGFYLVSPYLVVAPVAQIDTYLMFLVTPKKPFSEGVTGCCHLQR